MTDHIPNDLSHLSDAEFNSLCPQGEHAPGPEPLSPAAQAVWTAYETADCDPYFVDPRKAGIAAALRALVSQAKVLEVCVGPGFSEIDEFIAVRDLLAIADELEGQP